MHSRFYILDYVNVNDTCGTESTDTIDLHGNVLISIPSKIIVVLPETEAPLTVILRECEPTVYAN